MKFNIFKNKKGWFLQVILGIVILFSVSIIWALTFLTQATINTEVQADTTMTNQSKAVLQEQTNAYPDTFDSAIGFVSVAIWIIVLGLAYKAPSNPIFIIAAILVIACIGFVGMILANTWESIDSDSELGVYTNEFPIADFILSNFLIYILVISFSGVMVYLYSSGGVG